MTIARRKVSLFNYGKRNDDPSCLQWIRASAVVIVLIKWAHFRTLHNYAPSFWDTISVNSRALFHRAGFNSHEISSFAQWKSRHGHGSSRYRSDLNLFAPWCKRSETCQTKFWSHFEEYSPIRRCPKVKWNFVIIHASWKLRIHVAVEIYHILEQYRSTISV